LSVDLSDLLPGAPITVGKPHTDQNVLELTGSATVSEYQEVLRKVQYTHTGEEPTGGKRTIKVTVNDGLFDSSPVYVTVNVELVEDQRPIITLPTGTVDYQEEGPCSFVSAQIGAYRPWAHCKNPYVSVVPPTDVKTELKDGLTTTQKTVTHLLELADADSGTFSLEQAEVIIVDGLDGDGEALRVDNTTAQERGIGFTYNSDTYTLTLRGSAQVTAYEEVLRTVEYANVRDEPSGSSRTITFQAFDVVEPSALGGAVESMTVNIVLKDDAPMLDLDVSDGPESVDFNAGIYYEGDGLLALHNTSAGLGLKDDDSTEVASAILTLLSAPDGPHEVLAADVTGTSITASFDASKHVLVLEGPAPVADFAKVLATATYNHTESQREFTVKGAGGAKNRVESGLATPGERHITFTVTDALNGREGVVADFFFNVFAVNHGPELDLNGNNDKKHELNISLDFREEGAAVLVCPLATLRDADQERILRVTATIIGTLDMRSGLGKAPSTSYIGANEAGLQNAEILSVSALGTNIDATFDNVTGILTLEGPAGVSEFQKVLRTLKYQNDRDEPQKDVRYVAFSAEDGENETMYENRFRTGMAKISILKSNDRPQKNEETNNLDKPQQVNESSSIDIDVLSMYFDTDHDRNDLHLVVNRTTYTSNDGAFSVSKNGILTYTPLKNYFGTDSLELKVCDAKNSCSDKIVVAFNVLSRNDEPTVHLNTLPARVLEDGIIEVYVVAIDPKEPRGREHSNRLRLFVKNGSSAGLLGFIEDDPYEADLIPDPISSGTTLPYTNLQESATANGLVTYNKISEIPCALQNSSEFKKIGDVSNDLSATCEGTSAHVLTYEPHPNIHGNDRIAFDVCDDFPKCTLVEIIVTVISVNDQPVAEDEQSYMEEDSSLELDLMSLVEDAQYERKLVPGDISISEEPQNGNVTYNESDGTASYTPLENYHGSDAFNYTVCDAGNPKMCSTARITVDIESVNDEPEILEIPPSLFVNEDSSVEIPLMTYVKDAEYEPKLQNDRIAIVEEEEVLPKHGSIFYESDSGNAIYQPQKKLSRTR
jgi:hypothetical protein